MHAALGYALMQSGDRAETIWIPAANGKRKAVNALVERPSAFALAEAIAEFRAAVALRPQNSLYHCDLGDALMTAGQQADALGQYRIALNLTPSAEVNPDTAPWDNYQFLGELYNRIGTILSDRKDFAGAIDNYQECLHYEPEHLGVENKMAELLNQTGKRREARAVWQDVLVKFARLDQNEYRSSPYGTEAQALLKKYLDHR